MSNQFHKSLRKVTAQENAFGEAPSLNSALDFVQIQDKGESGFTEAKQAIVEMVMDGFTDIDIVIKIHEMFSQSIAQKALSECKRKGLL
jgi:hypothetical protein